MTNEQEVLQQFVAKRAEVVTALEHLQAQVRRHNELLLRVEGAIEAFGLINIELDTSEDQASE